jgi:hypothetical protein
VQTDIYIYIKARRRNPVDLAPVRDDKVVGASLPSTKLMLLHQEESLSLSLPALHVQAEGLLFAPRVTLQLHCHSGQVHT